METIISLLCVSVASLAAMNAVHWYCDSKKWNILISWMEKHDQRLDEHAVDPTPQDAPPGLCSERRYQVTLDLKVHSSQQPREWNWDQVFRDAGYLTQHESIRLAPDPLPYSPNTPISSRPCGKNAQRTG